MNAAEIAALVTGITACVGALTGLIVTIGHLINHDKPAPAQPVTPPTAKPAPATPELPPPAPPLG